MDKSAFISKIAAQSQAKQNTKAKLQKCNDAVNDNALVLDLVLANFNDVVPRTYRLLKRIIIQLYYSINFANEKNSK
ncbi:unnamed protein product [Acanthoscelides obtectus]|uniref:Uncharacterized protein n=1 Tax=Acanthoscelides obtectus TaxID=200917 RepID=A0A9P0KF64_ACAOB|nr:unnamed protein product [Acanthoscelides obtectus]CAK1632391.1 hypothetical protein AOBTE_LOCUS7530 [Acanthoscelides obtectus]